LHTAQRLDAQLPPALPLLAVELFDERQRDSLLERAGLPLGIERDGQFEAFARHLEAARRLLARNVRHRG